MDVKECPHCGDVVSEQAPRCTCGFPFPADGRPVAGAEAARVVAKRTRTKAVNDEDSQKVEAVIRPAEAGVSQGSSESERRGKSGSGMRPTVAESDKSRLIGCPSCAARISKRANACPKCGVAPWADCMICAARIRSGSSMCPECGDPDPFNP